MLHIHFTVFYNYIMIFYFYNKFNQYRTFSKSLNNKTNFTEKFYQKNLLNEKIIKNKDLYIYLSILNFDLLLILKSANKKK